jgi:hypothetical protein
MSLANSNSKSSSSKTNEPTSSRGITLLLSSVGLEPMNDREPTNERWMMFLSGSPSFRFMFKLCDPPTKKWSSLFLLLAFT